MSPQFHSLLAKEWSEHRRLFWLGTALITFYLGYCIAYEFEYRTRAFVASFYQTSLFIGGVGGVLLAMTTATGEYSQNTLRFSASLPISLRTVAWARLLCAWVCQIGPILIAAVIVTVLLGSGFIEQAELRGPYYRYYIEESQDLPNRASLSTRAAVGFVWTVTAIAIVSSIHLSTLISVLGTFCRREGTVGFIGAIVFLFSLAFSDIRSTLETRNQPVFAEWIGGLLPLSMAINWGYGQYDGSSYTDLELAPLILGPLVINVLVTLGLAAWFTRWYGRRGETSRSLTTRRKWRWWPQMPRLFSRLPLQWPSRSAELVWLDARQSLPLCISGLIVAFLFTVLSLQERRTDDPLSINLAGQLSQNTIFVGLLWGAMVAVGIFSAELKPGLEHFWRSRPISPRAWFWTKFFVGMFTLLMTLDFIPLFIRWYSGYQHPKNSGYLETGTVSSLLCMTLQHAQVFALTVAAICWLRRPIPAAILGLMLSHGVDQVLESIPVHPQLSTASVLNKLSTLERDHKPLDLVQVGYPLVYGIVVLITIVAVVLAARVVLRPLAGKLGMGILLLLGLCGRANAQEETLPLAAEVIAGAEWREALIQDLRLRLSTHTHWTADFGIDQQSFSRRKWTAKPSPDRDRIHEFLNKGNLRAWTEFDARNDILSRIEYDGTVVRDYRPRGSSMIYAAPKPPSTTFANPVADLVELKQWNPNHSIIETLKSTKFDSIEDRTVDGERLIDFTIEQPAQSTAVVTDGISQNVNIPGRRLTMTVNASRDFWPIRVLVEQLADREGNVTARHETTAREWIQAGPIVFPKFIEQKKWAADPTPERPPNEPRTLYHTETRSSEILEVALNSGLTEATFKTDFPPGTSYYDQRDNRYCSINKQGILSDTPLPRGIRGAVFAYHILWISAMTIYLFRRRTISVCVGQ